jgi:hypothetical protein
VLRAEQLHAASGPIRGCLYVCHLRSYAQCIEMLHELGAFTTEHLTNFDVIRQLQHADGFRRHDAIGRRINAGTWQKEKGTTRTLFLTDEDIYPELPQSAAHK